MNNSIKSSEDKIEEIAETLHLSLPTENIQIPLKFIAIFTLIGGLSIFGGLFIDIIQPNGSIKIGFYVLRLTIGILAISISYGLIKKERWAMWLYGVIAVIGLYLNPITILIPGAVLIYLYTIRKDLKICIADKALDSVLNKFYKS